MQRINKFFNVPESKEDCNNTDCNNCEHMRGLLMEAFEYHECFDEKKKLRYVKSVRMG